MLFRSTAARRNLSAPERVRLQAVIDLLRGGKQDTAMRQWATLVRSAASHGTSTAVDLDPLILHVLREACLEVNPDLSYLACRISARSVSEVARGR